MKTLITITLAAFVLVSWSHAAEQKPNMILIIAHDASPGDFGCYGHPHVHTPNIDKLAADGLRCDNAYVTTSSCSPSRCSLRFQL